MGRRPRRDRLDERLRLVCPFGPVPALLLVASAVTLLVRWWVLAPAGGGERLVMWSSADPHLEAYESILEPFEREHGVKVELRSLHFRVIDRRLRSAMWAGRGVPDLVEIPQEKLGAFLRGPVEDMGFLDLSERLDDPGPAGRPIREDIVPARLKTYVHAGRTIGLPHDVHPVAIAYRWRDFAEAGIDPASLETWEDFLVAGRALSRRERTPGSPVDDRRFMLAADETTPIVFQSLLIQRGGNWFGDDGELLLESDIVLDTLLWYIRMAYGPDRIADGAAAFPNPAFYQAVKSGYYVCFICPDWLSKNLEVNLPSMAGELRLMPMPAWEPGGRRTSTWGATMLAITEACERPDLAWELAKHLYVNTGVAEQTFAATNIVTPFRSTWSSPVFAEPRPYWGGQRIGELYLSLADDVPTLRNGPFPRLLLQEIVDLLSECGRYHREHGNHGFEAFARARLASTADEIRRQAARDPF